MLRVIDFKQLLRYFALITTGTSIALYSIVEKYFPQEMPLVRVLTIATWVSVFLIFALTMNYSGRLAWSTLRKFNKSLYPDLNGTWEGSIELGDGAHVPAKARIMQGLFVTQIDMHTKTSQSTTLEATPSLESGQFRLYYVFRSTPKNPEWHTYIGSTIFSVRNASVDDPPLELSGHYYTDRKTRGRVHLAKINEKTDIEISFY